MQIFSRTFFTLLGQAPVKQASFWLVLIVAVAAFAAPELAHAHVKWFVQFDLLCPPRSPFSVLASSQFLMLAALVAPVMFGISYIDQRLSNASILRPMGSGGLTTALSEFSQRVGGAAPAIIRVAVAGFFFALFCYGNIILTPELRTDQAWVHWLQLAMAVLLLVPRLAWVGALGIAVLYAVAVAKYGAFHMLDYPIFLGIGLYIALWSLRGERSAVLADAVLRSFTSVTLLWGGIEKFAYPEWSFGLLQARPELTFGLNPEFYMLAAGFVEFCAAYLLITGRLASRASAMVLLCFFLLAIIPFGAIDAVGHSAIIVVLVILAFGNGNAAARIVDLREPRKTALMNTVIFASVLVILMTSYYGAHFASFGH